MYHDLLLHAFLPCDCQVITHTDIYSRCTGEGVAAFLMQNAGRALHYEAHASVMA